MKARKRYEGSGKGRATKRGNMKESRKYNCKRRQRKEV